jgi:hypothetical protein
VNRNQIEEKIKEYHDKHHNGEIHVYSNVVVIGEILTSLVGEDKDCICLVLHDKNHLDGIFHLTIDAAIKLVAGISELLELEDDDDE